MVDLKRKFVALVTAVAMGSVLTAGAFGQKGSDKDRPPKPDNKVVVKEKDPKPPPNNNTRPPKNDDKKGKPLY